MNVLDIKLTYKCNNRCSLCCQDDEIKNNKSTLAGSTIYEYIKKMPLDEIENTKVVLTGGEPTLHPNILEIIKMLRGEGFKAIQLQSNLTLKSLAIGTEDLVNAGITSFGISLHGCTAEMHESFTNTKGSFTNTVNNLIKLSQLGIPVALNCVISKYNINNLSDIVTFAAKKHLADSIQFAFIHITGRADKHHNLIPTISSAAGAVQKAVVIANRFGIDIKSEAIPFCLMHGFERNVAELEKLSYITILDKTGAMNFSEHREESLKTKCEVCKQCLFYSMCEGPWAEYPQLFGWEEFIPVRSVKPYA
ncbi:MAG: radical SAM protein [Lachnospiraceae bacterium]|nr:radical SAM protein [Lachnospiraceae bacterium]